MNDNETTRYCPCMSRKEIGRTTGCVDVSGLRQGNAVKDFFSVKTGLDGEWGI